MDVLYKALDICSDNGVIGTLVIKRDGLYYDFDARCASVAREEKLALVGDGITYLLGTPVPWDGIFRLHTRRSLSSLKAAGITDITSCTVIGNDTDNWRETAAPGSYFTDPELCAACDGKKGVLMDRDQIAFPLSDETDFPLLPVFCFGEPGRIRGRDYIIFHLLNGQIV